MIRKLIKNTFIKSLKSLGYRLIKEAPNNYKEIYSKYKDYTMIPIDSYLENLKLASLYCSNLDGDIIECGVWRGGMIAGIANVLGNKNTYFLFDSFEGLPKAKEQDGKMAIEWQNDKLGINYHDNCKAEEKYALSVMQNTNCEFRIIPGWFSTTLDTYKGNIALLRLDADWYESTLQIFEKLFPYVINNGLIIIDDYYTWEGCSKAVHDYLSRIKSKSKIYKGDSSVAYIIKNEL